jgi:hypothetical protein
MCLIVSRSFQPALITRFLLITARTFSINSIVNRRNNFTLARGIGGFSLLLFYLFWGIFAFTFLLTIDFLAVIRHPDLLLYVYSFILGNISGLIYPLLIQFMFGYKINLSDIHIGSCLLFNSAVSFIPFQSIL